MTTDELLDLGPVIPVVVLDDAAHAVPLARALLAGGLRTIEVTLRTPAALEAIERIAAEVPIDAASAPDWLALPNVACVGGTWLARGPLASEDDFARVTALARAASELRT
jgi:2-keto-3-deoxy-6-phosphogluconate aldolase